MKKLFSLTGFVVIIIALITSSCEKPLDEQIIGKWEVTFQKYQAFNVDVLVSEEIDTMETNEMVIEITEGGTGKTWGFDVLDSEFTWVLEGSMCTVTTAGDIPQVMEFDTTIKKDKLTLVWTIENNQLKGETITKTVMIVIAKRI
jgi:hypothetical protein